MTMKVGGSITGSINSTMAIINSKERLIGVFLQMKKFEIINNTLTRYLLGHNLFVKPNFYY